MPPQQQKRRQRRQPQVDQSTNGTPQFPAEVKRDIVVGMAQAEGDEQPSPVTMTVDAGDVNSVREAADRIREYVDYDGTMTPHLLRKLEPLLYMPTPAKFVAHTPRGEGHPYDATGIKSVQVQADRMNAALGQEHWRAIIVYKEAGTLAKAIVVIGNSLWQAGVDENDQLVANGADIIVAREGWGGWKRGSSPGDIWKASETNALKRVLARFGPAADVYSQDFEDDPAKQAPDYVPPTPPPGGQAAAAAPAPAQPAAAQPQSQVPDDSQGQPTEAEAEGMIQEILAGEGTWAAEPDMLELRKQAHDAMLGLTDPPDAVTRYNLLAPRANDPHQIQALINRAQSTEQQAAQAQAAPPPEPVGPPQPKAG